MKTIRGTQEKLTQLNEALNKHFGYPCQETLTLNYSVVQQEFGTGEFCLMVLAKDLPLIEVSGLVVEDGNTIKTAPMPELQEQPVEVVEETPVAVVPEIL